MASRFIPTHLQSIHCAMLMAAAMLAGCSDGAEFTVRGTATGLRGPLNCAWAKTSSP